MSTKLKAGTATSGAVIDADTTGILELQSGSTPTTAITVNASQAVGIGTASPAGQLEVYTSIYKRFIVSYSGTYATVAQIGQQAWITNDASIDAVTYSNTSASAGAYHAWVINGLEKMRIDSSGNLLVGTTNTSQSTGVGVKISPNGNVWAVSPSADGYSLYNSTAGAYRFYVSSAGTISATNTTISAISDQRFKENIVDLDVGLDAVMALQPRKFDWKEGKGKDIKGDRGFIAQEFEQVFPDLIDEWKDPAPKGEEPYKSVRQDLIPVLVKAIQELNAKVDAQAAEIAVLKGAK